MHKYAEEDNDFYTNLINIYFVTPFTPFFRESLGFTPNGITCLSILFVILSLYCLWNKQFVLFFIFWHINYWFDCMDGYMARKYKLESNYGDWLDHISDFFGYLIGFLIILFKHNALKKKHNIKWLIIGIITTVIQNIHLGCLEKKKEKIKPELQKSESLNFIQSLCKNTEWMKYTKYFGPGNNNIIISSIAILMSQ